MRSKDKFGTGLIEDESCSRYVNYVEESVRKMIINGPRKLPASGFEIKAVQVNNFVHHIVFIILDFFHFRKCHFLCYNSGVWTRNITL